MELRLAKEDDREIILKIYDDGSKKLKSLGLDQWQGQDKPNLDNFKELKENKNIFVLDDQGQVVSTVIIYDFDIDYENNLDGTWQSPKPYVALHRIGTLKRESKQGDDKRFIEIFKEGSLTESMKILLDTETGVNYLYISAGYGMGITPLLDGEGKVIVSNQREIASYKERI